MRAAQRSQIRVLEPRVTLKVAIGAGWPRRCVDESVRAALLAEVDAKLVRAIDDQGLRFPIETNIAAARA